MSYISVHDFKKKLEKTISNILIDVRTKTEYVQGHIPGAINIPLQAIQEDAEHTIPQIQALLSNTDEAFYIVCLSDGRSQMARLRLKDYDINNGVYIAGGMSAWIRAGYAVEEGPTQE